MGICWVAFRVSHDVGLRIATDEDELDTLLETEESETSMDLDKAWHGMHWVLTGSTEPTSDVASSAIFGGTPVGVDRGYGPPRLLDPDKVAEVAEALAHADPGAVHRRFDPAAMSEAEVYPAIWDEEDIFESYLLPSLRALAEFYAVAAQRGESVLQVLC